MRGFKGWTGVWTPPPLRCVRGCKLDMRAGSKVVVILLFSISWFALLTSVIQRVDAEKS